MVLDRATTVTADAVLERRLTHLEQLEAESIHIIREVAAEFQNPVMMYSIGKDSSVMARLAKKAFHPGKLPFPLLHIDTTWKFKEMIRFRDSFVKENGLDLIVHTNPEGRAQNINPFRSRVEEVHRRDEDAGAPPSAFRGRLRRGVRRRASR
jgi:3'-phosphoadenosine 5'-phosphosulfate sulfotransferase (PAPS reductase)/FAD synthetase